MKILVENNESNIVACLYTQPGNLHEDSWLSPNGWGKEAKQNDR